MERVEGEEIRILAVRVAKNLRLLRFALPRRICDSRPASAISTSPRARRAPGFVAKFPSPRTELVRFAFALLLHALVDCVAVLRRQVGVTDAYVDNLNAKTTRFLVQIVANVVLRSARELDSMVAKVCGAQHAAKIRAEIRIEPKLRAGLVEQRLIEAQRIDDTPARECIHDDALFVLGNDLFRRRLRD